MNDKREGKRGKKKIWVAILTWEKKWYIDEEEKYGGFSSIIIMGEKYGMVMKKTEKYGDFLLQRKETFPVS